MVPRLTIRQAANILNVSPEYLVRLLNNGTIRCDGTGNDRQLRSVDVVAYKERRDGERRAGLRELSQLTQDLGGYDAEHMG